MHATSGNLFDKPPTGGDVDHRRKEIFESLLERPGLKIERIVSTGQASPADSVHMSSRSEKPVPNAKSDHGRRKFYDEDGEFPIPPPKKSFHRSARR